MEIFVRNHDKAQHLTMQELLDLRSNEAAQIEFQLVAETGSTNDDLLRNLASLNGPTVLSAAAQTAGKGRAGRTWIASPHQGLTFSFAWKMHQPAQELMGLSLAIGVAIADALKQLHVAVQLKWPNDILREQKKFAGILIETAPASANVATTRSSSTAEVATWVVIGVGLNLAVDATMEATIGHAVADSPWLAQMNRNLLLSTLVNHMASAVSVFEKQGLRPFIERWKQYHAHEGKLVRMVENGSTVAEGIVLGIDARGALLLQTEHGQQTFYTGDVSLRAV
jgi:BirA family transcriptional regulator, biotin operon repressor / biotin---[acetyl-CoA-carboxylase] ligase